jgi:hypothetical protein
MLKKHNFAAVINTAGEVCAYVTINKEAAKLAKRDALPPLVIPPTKARHYLWAEMTTDPTKKHSDSPMTTR